MRLDIDAGKIVFLFLLLGCLVYADERSDSLVIRSAHDSIRVSPRKAMLFSAIIPGTGQLYVRKPLKALLFSCGEAFCIRQIIYYNKINNYVEEAQKEVGQPNWDRLDVEAQKDSVKAITGYNLKRAPWKAEEARNKTYWWILGIHIVSMLDAYVDAHLINFPANNVELSSFHNRQSYGINLSIKF